MDNVLTIKNYDNDEYFILNSERNAVCIHGFRTVEQAKEWLDANGYSDYPVWTVGEEREPLGSDSEL